MPSLGFGEILMILILALLIFGPRRLPEMGRQIGRSLRDFRRAAADIRAEIEEDLDDEPLGPGPSGGRSSTGKAPGASTRRAPRTSPPKAPRSTDGPPETPNGDTRPV